MKIRFKDEFLFITGIGFGILSFFTNSIFPSFMFGVCLGFMTLNRIDKKKEEQNG
jgi:hypothetical protein